MTLASSDQADRACGGIACLDERLCRSRALGHEQITNLEGQNGHKASDGAKNMIRRQADRRSDDLAPFTDLAELMSMPFPDWHQEKY